MATEFKLGIRFHTGFFLFLFLPIGLVGCGKGDPNATAAVQQQETPRAPEAASCKSKNALFSSKDEMKERIQSLDTGSPKVLSDVKEEMRSFTYEREVPIDFMVVLDSTIGKDPSTLIKLTFELEHFFEQMIEDRWDYRVAFLDPSYTKDSPPVLGFVGSVVHSYEQESRQKIQGILQAYRNAGGRELAQPYDYLIEALKFHSKSFFRKKSKKIFLLVSEQDQAIGSDWMVADYAEAWIRRLNLVLGDDQWEWMAIGNSTYYQNGLPGDYVCLQDGPRSLVGAKVAARKKAEPLPLCGESLGEKLLTKMDLYTWNPASFALREGIADDRKLVVDSVQAVIDQRDFLTSRQEGVQVLTDRVVFSGKNRPRLNEHVDICFWHCSKDLFR